MMKENIEELMKNALHGYELPYNEAAWDSFQNKLDVKQGPKAKKWWLFSGIAVVSALSFLTLWYVSNDSKSVSKNYNENNSIETSKSSNEQKNNSTSKVGYKSNEKHSEKLIKSLVEQENLITSNEINTTITEVNNINNNSKSSEILSSKEDVTKTIIEKDKIISNNNDNNLNENLVIPSLGQKCKGESILIENKNNIELILRTPSGREIGIDAKSTSEISLKEIGTYHVGYSNHRKNDSFQEMENFKVINTPSIGLTIEEDITYENGLPTIKAEVATSEENVTWRLNQHSFKGSSQKNKSNEFHFFNKGTYVISAQTTNEQGCETKENKTVTISEDYNLLAVNAFNPNSTDFRKNTFIPFALTVRNVPFNMVILDPDTGGVIYETSDASNAWDGIDRRDGKMVNANKAYIWKVSILKPEPNEKSEYRGTIIRIP